jgi:hypothetical protein
VFSITGTEHQDANASETKAENMMGKVQTGILCLLAHPLVSCTCLCAMILPLQFFPPSTELRRQSAREHKTYHDYAPFMQSFPDHANDVLL